MRHVCRRAASGSPSRSPARCLSSSWSVSPRIPRWWDSGQRVASLPECCVWRSRMASEVVRGHAGEATPALAIGGVRSRKDVFLRSALGRSHESCRGARHVRIRRPGMRRSHTCSTSRPDRITHPNERACYHQASCCGDAVHAFTAVPYARTRDVTYGTYVPLGGNVHAPAAYFSAGRVTKPEEIGTRTPSSLTGQLSHER